jgi:cellulose synthase (UDP-forming)
LSYIVFPLAVALVYAFLIHFGYRRPSEINRVFIEYSRPARLKKTIGFWFVGIGAVFLFVQWLRLPYYIEFLSRLARVGEMAADPAGLAIVAAVLVILICEWIIIAHWTVYLVYSWIGITRYQIPERLPLPDEPPEVLVLIACCNEEPSTLRRSLKTVTQLHYPRKKIYLVENSRDFELKAEATQLAKQYGVDVLHVPNRGHKAGAMNDAMNLLRPQAPYFAIIDADQRVEPDFLKDIVPLLEADASLAFAQTPQLYDNAEETWLCRAAAQQEMLLYDTILEAKGAVGRALCCGTNFVMRRSALEDVGGWDENTVSEDLATSFLIHRRGWKSVYVRRAYAWGLGPLNLPAYWKQQKRWAVGNTTVVRQVLRAFFTRKPRAVPLKIAVDYFWSASYYITTLALAGLATLPMLLVLASYFHAPHSLQAVPDARPVEWLFLSVYPFYAAVMLFPYVHMRLRGYPVRNLVMLQGLLSITFPIYAFSVLRGLFKRITFFEIAPKRFVMKRQPLWGAPQTLIILALALTGTLLAHRVTNEPWSSVAWIALFWAFFYTICVGHYFIFAAENQRLLKRKLKMPALAPDTSPLAEPTPTVRSPLLHAEETQTHS